MDSVLTTTPSPHAVYPSARRPLGRVAWRLPLMMCILGLPAWIFGGCSPSASREATATDADWVAYKSRYLMAEGRITDTSNGNVSHTEGQGYGMLLAVHYRDRPAFDAMWTWTKAKLTRPDGLLSWRWRPDASGNGGAVDDPNNASDGEILITWALVRAGKAWGEATYTAEGQGLARLVVEKLVVKSPAGDLLLPGIVGFRKPENGGRTIVNLSYWIFPALEELREATGVETWNALGATGRRLISLARYGRWKLAPDWLSVDDATGAVSMPPATEFPQEFGYNAFRIPLYVAWAAGQAGDRELLRPFVQFWSEQQIEGRPAATVRLDTDEVAEYAGPPGEEAIYLLVRAVEAGKSPRSIRWPALVEGDSYYSATLLLLTKAAASDLEK
ncbi:endoglucanase [Verrucomicrobia bacterium LW23]|nr:endoglucanase [Verrucomicrobia bacterium LW23]